MRAWLRSLSASIRAYMARDVMDDELDCGHQDVGVCDVCYARQFEARAW